MLSLFLQNEQSTIDIAQAVAKLSEPPLIIYLQGELGAGKTTFSRAFIRSFGFEGAIKSPTFTLVESYHINGREIFHFDLYRINDPEELEFIGLWDYVKSDAICMFEWPEKAQGILPVADLSCHLDIKDAGRQLTIEAGSEKGQSILSALATAT